MHGLTLFWLIIVERERERENDDDNDILCGANIQGWLGGLRLALNRFGSNNALCLLLYSVLRSTPEVSRMF